MNLGLILICCGLGLLLFIMIVFWLIELNGFKWIGRNFMKLVGILIIIMEDNHLGYLILKRKWGRFTDHILFMLCLNTPTIHWWWYSLIKEGHSLATKADWFNKRYRYNDKDGKYIPKY